MQEEQKRGLQEVAEKEMNNQEVNKLIRIVKTRRLFCQLELPI